MNYSETSKKLAEYREQIAAVRAKMREAQAATEPQAVEDYTLSTPEGTARLSGLFGAKDDLIVIHNMGASCRYCTLWADGFNGVYAHLADRAAFVMATPDAPAAQKKFAESRGWRFPMVSHQGTSFAADMGYRSEKGGWLPGVSVFRRDGKRLLRVSDAPLHPGDDFCALWHMFDMLQGGPGDWEPRFKY
ncbi:MAG TPA: DUF899 family protein [Stellaceae bacterium]|nr:DUF899 family protein [Stellaceae bacterium]